MSNVVIPSQMTENQIDKAVAIYRAMLEKYAAKFSSEAVQAVLGSFDFSEEQFKLFRTRVEIQGALVTRTASVDRTRTPKEAMVATGCQLQNLNEGIVSSIPLGDGDVVTMSFHCFYQHIASDMLDEELAKVGLELIVDPVGLAAVNEAYPEFACTYPNLTRWKNADGKFCYVFFDAWRGKRHVDVGQHDDGWIDISWFPVRCK